MSQQTSPKKPFMPLFTEHIYVMQSKILSDITNNLYQPIKCRPIFQILLLTDFQGNCMCMAAWRSGNGVGRINEVTLRRSRLVLGYG